jgi:Gluconate 2-dehydrogenase subunit 3
MNRREILKQTTVFIGGYAIATTTLSSLLTACRQEAKLSWKPIFLSPNQAQTVAAISDTILPKTTTPSASEVGVPQFIDKMLKDTQSEDDQKAFLKGLTEFEEKCEEKYKKPFIECSPAEREAFCIQAEKESGKLPPTMWGITLVANPDPISFFKRVKGLAITGYYTSEKIGKEVLSYDPVPGQYIGCMPLNGTNTWNE